MIIKPWQTELSVTGGSRKPPLRSKWCFSIHYLFIFTSSAIVSRSLSLWRLRDNRYLLPFVLLHCVLTCNLLRHNFCIKKISFRIRSCQGLMLERWAMKSFYHANFTFINFFFKYQISCSTQASQHHSFLRSELILAHNSTDFIQNSLII